MLSKIRPRSGYDVVAVIALFVALGGTSAYAANTVFSSDIVDGEVKTPDLGNGVVNGSKLAPDSVASGRVVDNSLGGIDIAERSLTGADIADKSLKAADIAADAIGARQLGNLSYPQQTTSIPPSGGVGEVIVECPAGYYLLSGGAYFAFHSGDLTRSTRSTIGERWIAAGQNNGNAAQNLTATAICLVVDP